MLFANVGYALGRVMVSLAFAHIAPMLAAWGFGEKQAVTAFGAAGFLTLFSGGILLLTYRDTARIMRKRDIFVLAILGWPMAAFFAGLGFYLTGSVPSVTAGFFEALSGLTTTGASVINDIDLAPRSVHLWRALLSWIGGMIIVSAALMFTPLVNLGGAALTSNILPRGEGDTLVDRLRGAAMPLMPVYAWLTAACLMGLWLAGMPFFDALCHALSTLSSGGFSTRDQSVAAFDLPVAEWVLIPFMILAGINFTFHWALFKGRGRNYLHDREVKGYLMLIGAAALVLVTGHMALTIEEPTASSVLESLRVGLFAAASSASTTGFLGATSVPFTLLGVFALSSLVFIGGTTGSAAGGIKVMRMVILVRHALRELKRLTHPNRVIVVRFNHSPTPESALMGVWALYALFIFTLAGLTMAFTLTESDLASAFFLSVSCLTNSGPAIFSLDPSFAGFPALSEAARAIYCLGMVVGRLEIMGVFVLFTAAFWRN